MPEIAPNPAVVLMQLVVGLAKRFSAPPADAGHKAADVAGLLPAGLLGGVLLVAAAGFPWIDRAARQVGRSGCDEGGGN